jgi:hypothetical protein
LDIQPGVDQSVYTHGNISFLCLAKARSPTVQEGFDFLLCSIVSKCPLVIGFFRASITSSWAHRYRSSLGRHPIHDPEFLSSFQICGSAPPPLSLMGQFCHPIKFFSMDFKSLNSMIQKERVKGLNKKEMKKGAYVLYWMHASQRAEYNHALEYVILKGI